MNYFLTLSLALGAALTVHGASAQPASTPKYVKTPTGFLLVLRQGDNVLQELEQLATREKISGASLTGLGFVHPTFGFWNKQTKTYDPKSLRDTELASLTGSIAWKDNKPALHLHGVVTDNTFAAYGGHILALEVGTGSVEITVTVHPQRFIREVDERNGATVMSW
ncbi:PPC domain-containing DNA-binding protein [Hymenobacter cellulosilyticus]|uniref:DNA-binding protein n=1 Tax=Hymenobacter cellulosilyticus TaxID=2932248 RepID=A0A8T9Q0Y9_9BACT|nr:PPC domain-containing DNA-binding protein [Hymenobacter cellulosilyticus]UOQ71057.1 DNA-binding protein [Hymenobacter cellulosilyticus]